MAETNATLTSKHAAYLGLDVGKFAHWAYAVDRGGEVLLSRRVANSEDELDALMAVLPADTLVVVDQRRNIGALAIRRARRAGRPVAYLPGSAEHELAKSFPGCVSSSASLVFHHPFLSAVITKIFPVSSRACPAAASASGRGGRLLAFEQL